MKSSSKYIIKEGAFNWLLKLLLGKSTATKVRYWAAIKTDPKLAKLSREFEKSAKELEQTLEKRMATPGSGGHTSHYKNLQNILSQD